jgi:hypothetical protein
MMNLGLMDPGFLGSLTSYDSDAAVYISAVEVADGQALETGVKDAINAFVVGCKADGIWNAIKTSCIMAGARTLAGALVPLVGTAPTNFNFVAGDYNRKTGLIGNATTKYLNSNRLNNADPQDSKHLAVYRTAHTGASDTRYMSTPSVGADGYSLLGQQTETSIAYFGANRVSGFTPLGSTSATPAGLYGVSRSSAATETYRVNGASTAAAVDSRTPTNDSIFVFGTLGWLTPARLAFYSIGESLDLALLDVRITDLINAFAAAIP